ncbi:unnamed protein product [Arctogadus glacialis]
MRKDTCCCAALHWIAGVIFALPSPPPCYYTDEGRMKFCFNWRRVARRGPRQAAERGEHREPPEEEGHQSLDRRRHHRHCVCYRRMTTMAWLYGYMENEPLTLQLFIGTADDRLLRPHAFYQVHRITGKTVSTASHEVLQSNTKVLEIPLLPENNMRAIIDCAGILKLRNSDIELRKGETDIGRKNTRVRMVFRVHITQPNGRTVSLQATSNAIECSQRSAQELPLVEKQSVDSYPATGGKKMLLSGLNFLPDSKVVFVEKAQDMHLLHHRGCGTFQSASNRSRRQGVRADTSLTAPRSSAWRHQPSSGR